MTRTRVRQILLLALGVGVLVDVVVPGNAAGVNAPLLMAALLGCASLVAGRDGIRRMDPADAWLAPAALGFAAMAAVRADDWLVAWDLVFAAALACAAIACLAGGRVTRGVVVQVVELAVGVIAAIGIGMVALLSGSGPHQPAATEVAGTADVVGDTGPDRVSNPRYRTRLRAARVRAAPILRGLVIAAPVVLVFAVLFALADAVFARLAGDVLAWRPDMDIADILRRSLIVGFTAWAVAGLLALGAGLLPVLMPGGESRDAAQVPFAGGRSLGAASAAQMAGRGRHGLGTAEAATVLLAVDLLFAAFVILQVAYLFGGHDTMALAGMTYADYARRGFFELVLVAVLAGLLVAAADVAVGRRSRAQLGASLALLGLTALVLVSAFVRLRLYQEAYGWTELRFVVLVAIGWLAVALAITAGLLLAHRTRWILHAMGILVLVTVAGMNVVGPQAFVAERNLERAIDPSLVPAGGRTGLDARYLQELGDEAVPSVVAALPRLGAADRAALEPFLLGRLAALTDDPALAGWPSWNHARAQARDALAGWRPGVRPAPAAP